MDKSLVVLIYIILGLHLVGLFFGLYLKTTWFDIPMHFLGGAWLLLAFVYGGKQMHFSALMHPFALFAMVLIVVLCWEVFEYSFNAIGPPGDTLLDIIVGLTGALAGYVLIHKSRTTTQ